MHASRAPSLGIVPEQPGMRRAAERCPPAPAHKTVADVIIDPDQVPVGTGSGDDATDFGCQLRADPLIGIDFEDPVAATRRDPGIAPLPLALPCALDDTVGEAAGDLRRAVVAAV